MYELQRAVDAQAALRDRAEGLLEVGRQMRVTGDRARLGELRRAIEDVEARRQMTRLELAGLAGDREHPSTVLRVSPVSAGEDSSAWVRRLVAMYAGWAARSGRTAAAGADGSSLTIDGASTFDLLAAERGLHRWVPSEKEVHPCLARVALAGLEDPESIVVRIYDEGRDLVRDPRTGAQGRNVTRVLSGAIDDFLVAAVATRTPAAATAGDPRPAHDSG